MAAAKAATASRDVASELVFLTRNGLWVLRTAPATGTHTRPGALGSRAGDSRMEVTGSRRLVTVRTAPGLCRAPWTDLIAAGHRLRSQPRRLDLILTDGQRFGRQPGLLRNTDPVRRPMLEVVVAVSHRRRLQALIDSANAATLEDIAEDLAENRDPDELMPACSLKKLHTPPHQLSETLEFARKGFNRGFNDQTW